MKPKTVVINGKTYVVATDEGLPIYVHGDGKEQPFDAPGTMARIGGLNREAQTHRETAEAANARLKAFEGIEDPEAARAALGTVGNLKAGDLKTAEQVDEIKREARKAAETQVEQTARQSAARLAELEKERNSFRDSLFQEKVGGAFSRSKYITDKTILPPDMLQAMFANNFKVEDGKIVPYDANGGKIYSSVRGGEIADFEEGIEHLIAQYPNKTAILKGTNNSGSGAPQNGGGAPQTPGGKPTMSRQQFEALGPMEKGGAARSHVIVDGGP